MRRLPQVPAGRGRNLPMGGLHQAGDTARLVGGLVRWDPAPARLAPAARSPAAAASPRLTNRPGPVGGQPGSTPGPGPNPGAQAPKKGTS